VKCCDENCDDVSGIINPRLLFAMYWIIRKEEIIIFRSMTLAQIKHHSLIVLS
jgi:hypothetical protein